MGIRITEKGYTQETPYWCTGNRRFCIHCKSCGDNLPERHQTSIYHCLLTASTLAFGFDYPWDDTVDPHSLPEFSNGWRWDDDFVDALARFAGFSCLRFDGTGALGVGPKTGYDITGQSADLILQKETQETLKRLIIMVKRNVDSAPFSCSVTILL